MTDMWPGLTTIASYYARSMDLLKVEVSEISSILSTPSVPKTGSDSSTYCPLTQVQPLLVADGCVIEGTVEDCVIFRGVHVGKTRW